MCVCSRRLGRRAHQLQPVWGRAITALRCLAPRIRQPHQRKFAPSIADRQWMFNECLSPEPARRNSFQVSGAWTRLNREDRGLQSQTPSTTSSIDKDDSDGSRFRGGFLCQQHRIAIYEPSLTLSLIMVQLPIIKDGSLCRLQPLI